MGDEVGPATIILIASFVGLIAVVALIIFLLRRNRKRALDDSGDS
jgi:hypothetical protein